MAICPICDDSGLMSSDSTHPDFCYCAAGKQAKRQWETSDAGKASGLSGRQGNQLPKPASFIDVSQLDQVNASVDAMRASLLGSTASEGSAPTTKNATVQLLQRVAHPGHEVSVVEAAQLHDLARALESFLGDLTFIGRKR